METVISSVVLSEIRQKVTQLYNAIVESNLLKKEMLSLSEAMLYLNISESYLYKLTAARIIPHYKPGGKLLYFRRTDLDAWMQSSYRPSEEMLKAKAASLAEKKSRNRTNIANTYDDGKQE